jgi:ribosomal protein S18 acetylase RimI-like enzyme
MSDANIGRYSKKQNKKRGYLFCSFIFRFAIMEHVLDNPAWNALISGNKNLANGNGGVRYFDKEVSPFVGLKNYSPGNFRLLHDFIQHDEFIGLISSVEIDIPQQWKVLNFITGFQMVYNQQAANPGKEIKLIPLTIEHVPQMLELTKLTKPGPFASRTIELGHYKGIFDGDNLVAMAGQRLHAAEYIEISAVCTHPDYLGRGYAKQLLLDQANRIIEAKGIPYLHVRNNNERAIKVYESLGFEVRIPIHFYYIRKVNNCFLVN